jgi:hypothetical protein
MTPPGLQGTRQLWSDSRQRSPLFRLARVPRRNMGETPRDVGREGEVLSGLWTEQEEPPQQPP